MKGQSRGTADFWPNFSPYVKSVTQTNCQIKCIKEENKDRITYYIHTSDCTRIYAKHSRQRNGPSNKIIKNKANIVAKHTKQCMKTFICLIRLTRWQRGGGHGGHRSHQNYFVKRWIHLINESNGIYVREM